MSKQGRTRVDKGIQIYKIWNIYNIYIYIYETFNISPISPSSVWQTNPANGNFIKHYFWGCSFNLYQKLKRFLSGDPNTETTHFFVEFPWFVYKIIKEVTSFPPQALVWKTNLQQILFCMKHGAFYIIHKICCS